MIACTGGQKKSEAVVDPSPQFTDSVDMEWSYLVGGACVPGAGELTVVDSSLYILANMGGQWVHEYNVNTGEETGSYVNRVSHVGELNQATTLSVDNSGRRFGIFNSGIYDRYMVSFNSNFEPEYMFNTDSLFIVNDILLLPSNRILSLSLVKEGDEFTGRTAISILDVKDGMRVLSTFDEAPSSIPLGLRRKLSASPSGKNLVSITPTGGYLEMFSLTGDSVVRTSISNYFPLEIDEQGIAHTEKGSKYGLRCATASDDHVYVAYCVSKEQGVHVSTVGVWNWDGTTVRKLNTDKDILSIAVTPDDSRLYCVSHAPGAGFIIYYMNL